MTVPDRIHANVRSMIEVRQALQRLGLWVDHFADLDGRSETLEGTVVYADGSRALTADWDAGSRKIKAEQLESDIAAGTAPLVVASDTVVANLNADKLDGNDAAAFAAVAHKNTHDPEDGGDALDTANAATITGVQAAGTGTAHSLARSDHVHGIAHNIGDHALVTIDDADAADGDYAKFTASGLEGRDKTEMLSDLNVADGADVTGSNAPQAHKDSHDPNDGSDKLDCAAAGAISPDTSAAEGSAHSFARSDHVHGIICAAPDANQTPDMANAEGSAATFARSDHVHGMPAGTPSDIGTSNSEGAGVSWVRHDHVHAIPAKWRRRHGHVEIPSPAVDDEFVIAWFDDPFTLEQIRAHVEAATSITYSIYERSYDTPDSAAGESTVVNADGATTTPADAAIADAAIAADKCLVLKVTAVVGTPGTAWVFWRGTID